MFVHFSKNNLTCLHTFTWRRGGVEPKSNLRIMPNVAQAMFAPTPMLDKMHKRNRKLNVFEFMDECEIITPND
jgi:hypothetical protein